MYLWWKSCLCEHTLFSVLKKSNKNVWFVLGTPKCTAFIESVISQNKVVLCNIISACVFVCSHGRTSVCCVLAWHLISHPHWEWCFSCLMFFSPPLNFTGLPTPISSQSGARGFLQKPNTCCLLGLHNIMRCHKQTCGTSYLSITPWSIFFPLYLYSVSASYSIWSLYKMLNFSFLIFLTFWSQMLRLLDFSECLCQIHEHTKHIYNYTYTHMQTHSDKSGADHLPSVFPAAPCSRLPSPCGRL